MVNKNPPTYITIKYCSWVKIRQLYFKLLHTSHVNHIINGFLFVISRKLLKVTNNYVDEISHAIMFWANIWYSLFLHPFMNKKLWSLRTSLSFIFVIVRTTKTLFLLLSPCIIFQEFYLYQLGVHHRMFFRFGCVKNIKHKTLSFKWNKTKPIFLKHSNE